MFENEQTLHRFMTESAEGQFHDNYEKAVEHIKSEFGKKYPMIIDDKEIKTSQTVVHTSPIDTRIVLGYLPSGSVGHVRQAIAAAKKAFEVWRELDWQNRVKIFKSIGDIMSQRKFELAAWISYENGKNRYEAIGD